MSQLLSLFCGLVVVRSLEAHEYAVYAVAGALIGVAGTTCDLGSGGALVAFLGKARTAPERIAVAATVDRLRRGLTLASIFLAFVLLGLHPTTSADPAVWVAVGFLSAAIIYGQSRTHFLKLLAAVDGKLGTIGRADVLAATVRLAVLSVVVAGLGLASSHVALLAWLAATLVSLWLLRHLHVREGASEPTIRKAVLDYARPLWFGHAYHVTSTLMPLFGLGLGAGTGAVAEFAALGRLGQIVSVVSPLLGYVMMPYVARGAFRRRAPVAVACMIGVATGIVSLGFVIPGPLLWVLGDQYRHLGNYVPLALAVTALGMLSGGLHQLILAGAHTAYQWLAVIAGIGTQAVLLLTYPPVDLLSAYVFALVTKTSVLVAYFGLVLRAYAVESQRDRQSLADMLSGR